MSVTVTDLFRTDYPEVGGTDPAAVVGYLCRGTDVFATAFAAVHAYSPRVDPETNLLKLKVKLDKPGPGVWIASVNYGLRPYVDGPTPEVPGVPPPPPPPPPTEDQQLGAEFSFSTTGGTEHRTQSVQTNETIRLAGDPAPPDHNRAIGVLRDGTVQGVDVVVPKLEFSVGAKLPYLTLKYVKTLRDLTGRTNASPFWTFDANEVLFLGADGRTSASDGANVNLHFAAGKNRVASLAGETIVSPGLTFSRIDAWEYAWVAYRDAVSNGMPTQEPYAGYVETVYFADDFAKLGVG